MAVLNVGVIAWVRFSICTRSSVEVSSSCLPPHS